MSPPPAIRVQSLSKRYRIGHKTEAQDTLVGTLTSFVRQPLSNLRRLRAMTQFGEDGSDQADVLWALKDVSFEVEQGEVLGVIGRNGAGKSTLLKILSRITHPTSGRVELRGRVSSLLEVGTGFHPELTGRENIYLNGTILGMRKTEIDRKFDEIVAFSGIEKFIDTPVKRYSSGMGVRLAFSVAAHLEPEILLIDEVLAVGDTEFQKKCLGKMGEVAGEGRTVLFVSHNMGALRTLCDRGLLLSEGLNTCDDTIEKVLEKYLGGVKEESSTTGERVWNVTNAPGGHGFKLRKIKLVSPTSEQTQSTFTPQEPIDVIISYTLTELLRGMRVVLQIRNQLGEIAFTSTDHSLRTDAQSAIGEYTSVCRIPGGLLNLGGYSIRLWAGIPGDKFLLEPVDTIVISIIGIGNHGSDYEDFRKWPGIVSPKLRWEINKTDNTHEYEN